MKKSSKKLSLAPQTVARLSSVDLAVVGGGVNKPAQNSIHGCIFTRNNC